jgi:hypothetical protein
MAFPNVGEVADGGEGEGLEISRTLGGGMTRSADVSETELTLVTVVEDKARALEEGHLTDGGRRRVMRPLVG